MATSSLFVCSSCGHTAPKWLGRCPDCEEWSTFVEEVREDKKVVGFAARATKERGARGAAGRTLALSEVPVVEGGGRMDTGVGELNRVLGGGIMPGSIVLIGGAAVWGAGRGCGVAGGRGGDAGGWGGGSGGAG